VDEPGALAQAIAPGSGPAVHVFTTASDTHGSVSASAHSAGAPAPGLAGALVELVRDADRAMRYLGLDDCDSILVECDSGVVALARERAGVRMAAVSSPAGTTSGSARRLVARVAASLEGSDR
jgi:hypothetical protein